MDSDSQSSIQCEYCKSTLKNQTNLIKHQFSSKSCKEIRKNMADNSTELLKVKNDELQNQLQKLIEDTSKKINIEVEFQKQIEDKYKKIQIELQYQEDLENNIKKNREKNLEIEMELKKMLEENQQKLKDQLHTNKKIESLKINLEDDIKIILNNNVSEMHKQFKLKIDEILQNKTDSNIVVENNNSVSISEDDKSISISEDDKSVSISEDDNSVSTSEDNVEPPNRDELHLQMLKKFAGSSGTEDMLKNVKPSEIVENVFDSVLENQYGDIINKIISHISSFLSDKKISPNNIMYIIIEMMKFIDNYYIKNVDKKELVIYGIKKFMNINQEQVEEFQDIIFLINKFIGDIIDIAISIDSKKTKIKNIKSCFIPFFS
jgi:hypothetical protein